MLREAQTPQQAFTRLQASRSQLNTRRQCLHAVLALLTWLSLPIVELGVDNLGITLHSCRRLGLQISAIRSASRPQVFQLAARYDVDLEKLFEPHFARLGMVKSSSKCSRGLGTSPMPCG